MRGGGQQPDRWESSEIREDILYTYITHMLIIYVLFLYYYTGIIKSQVQYSDCPGGEAVVPQINPVLQEQDRRAGSICKDGF